MRNKIGVIGAGLVGATAAFALSQSGLASEIVLIDANAQRARGEALDIEHGAAFAPPVLVRDGDYPDLAEAHAALPPHTRGSSQCTRLCAGRTRR